MKTQVDEKIDELRNELATIEEDVITGYTLSDAIREGSKSTKKAAGWGNGDTACTLSAAYMATKARGYI